MKKRILFFATFLIIAAGLTSCEELFNNCKICRLNTYEDGQFIGSADEAEYCGADLNTNTSNSRRHSGQHHNKMGM
ncbi:MAG: hypothetical protein U5K32_09440 [Bacteroidales bacterium]|nr:hypothetical protein [Bacteroidales bacterium]